MTKMVQQTPGCSDFDVSPGDSEEPAFRILLPEWIHGNGVPDAETFCHVIPGIWRSVRGGMHGEFAVAEQLAVAVRLEPQASGLSIVLSVTNIGRELLTDLWGNICTGLNHLPGKPSWANPHFFPGVPLQRALQGRLWYESIAPRHLFVLTPRGWRTAHSAPDAPMAQALPGYDFTPSDDADALAYAVQSPIAETWIYQAWRTSCRWCAPCSGNACMHLVPRIADRLEPGATASISGLAGMHAGDRESLEQQILRGNESA